VALASSLYGNWGKCIDGRKFFCCEAEAEVPDCRWTDCGGSCSSNEDDLTWKNTGCASGDKRRFCCSKEDAWTNCAWHGEPGSCYDNHCATGMVAFRECFD
jgi:chitinase